MSQASTTDPWKVSLSLNGEAVSEQSNSSGNQKRYALKDKVQFTTQLAMMIESGVSLSSALKSMIRQSKRPALIQLLNKINDDVHGGASLSKAMSMHPGMFDAAYVATIAAGEASGRMSEVLTGLADLLRSEANFTRTIRGMLIYPILLTGVSTLVILTLVVFVLPRFATIFSQYELTLPFITSLLLGISQEIITRWWLWGTVAMLSISGLVMLKTTPAGRAIVDRALLQTPVLKDVMKLIIGARACRLLGLLITSGVPLLECLTLLQRAIPNVMFQGLVDSMRDSITNGRSLSDSLETNEVLPESASEMIATAEKTGKLGEVSTSLGKHYGEEGRESARQLVSAIEPFLTIVMGGVVAAVVLAVMLPVFDIASLAQR